MGSHDICRTVWSGLKPYFDRVVPDSKKRKKCWAWVDHGYGQWHGPDKFFWEGNACCKWEAKYRGVSKFLREHYPWVFEQYEQSEKEIEL